MANANSPAEIADVLSRLTEEGCSVEVDVKFSDIELSKFRGKIRGFSNTEVHIEADDGSFIRLPIRDVKWGYTDPAEFGPVARAALERQGLGRSLEVRKAQNENDRYSITLAPQ